VCGYTGSAVANYAYGGYNDGPYADRYTGVAGNINYSSGDVALANYQHDHGLMFLMSSSRSDPNSPAGVDALQTGYAVGAIDQYATPKAEVYAEQVGPGTPYSAWLWPSLALGNHWFATYNSGITATYRGITYGLYQATYGRGANTRITGSAWMAKYLATSIVANVEGAVLKGSGDACPKVTRALFGTDGNLAHPGFNQSTVLEFRQSPSGPWTNWTRRTAFNTVTSSMSPYAVVTNFYSYAAWNAKGG
jgi:hypothetical protein